MLKSIWSGPTDQTTPKASLQSNPFDALPSAKAFSTEKSIVRGSPASSRKNSIASTIGPRTPTSKGFHFFEHKEGLQAPPSPVSSLSGALTPGAIIQASGFNSAPTTSISKVEPTFDFTVNPTNLTRNPPTEAPPDPERGDAPRGRLYVKLIQARGLSAPSPQARPYVVATFDQSEFVSREALDDSAQDVTDVAIKRPATPLRGNSSNDTLMKTSALSKALEAHKISEDSGNSRWTTPNTVSPAYNPIWRHEVILYVPTHLVQ